MQRVGYAAWVRVPRAANRRGKMMGTVFRAESTANGKRRPSFYGTKASFYGTKPSFYGTKPSFYGTKPSFYGTKPSFYGTKPSFYGTKPSFYGTRLRNITHFNNFMFAVSKIVLTFAAEFLMFFVNL
jgi:hypothetical protein